VSGGRRGSPAPQPKRQLWASPEPPVPGQPPAEAAPRHGVPPRAEPSVTVGSAASYSPISFVLPSEPHAFCSRILGSNGSPRSRGTLAPQPAAAHRCRPPFAAAFAQRDAAAGPALAVIALPSPPPPRNGSSYAEYRAPVVSANLQQLEWENSPVHRDGVSSLLAATATDRLPARQAAAAGKTL